MFKLFEKIEDFLDLGGIKKDVILLVISGIALFLSFFDLVDAPFNLAWVSIVLCGFPIIIGGFIGLIRDFDIKADVLVSLALIAAVLIGEDFAAGEVAFIMQIGALLEEITVARARAGIEKLVELTPQTARIIENGTEKIIPAEDVKVDDLVRVFPGETIPVDGVIINGETSINQAVMTGESLPVDKKVNDEVFSGSVNQYGAFDLRATKVGENSSIQRLIKLVQSADAGKAKIVGIADRWATWIVAIALISAALTWFVTGEIIRAVTILVVFCPCALVLATPTAIMAAIGNATKHGFLVKEGDALERLSKVNKIIFDKTGTLTYGKPKVVAVESFSEEYSEKDIFKLCASIEQFSEHPLGKAIVESYRQEYKEGLLTVDNFKMNLSRGVSANIDNRKVSAGNIKMLNEENIVLSDYENSVTVKHQQEGHTVIYVAIEDRLIGFIALADIVREESKSTIKKLRDLNIDRVLLTGDHDRVANAIADELGIEELQANCLPEDKLGYIGSNQKKNEFICMIGDGINDAPALKMADVGIAMGGVGSDIAIDAADIALVNDDLKGLPHLIALSKRMMTTIKLNMTFSLALNFIAIILAMIGALSPVLGALVHNAGSVIVVLNSVLLLRWKGKNFA